MRLSDAIALGRTVVEKIDAGSFCGCAIGMGLAALGYNYGSAGDRNFSSGQALADARREWPWLTKEFENPFVLYDHTPKVTSAESIISCGFWAVQGGHISLETVIDWASAHEPGEANYVDVPVEEVEYASVT